MHVLSYLAAFAAGLCGAMGFGSGTVLLLYLTTVLALDQQTAQGINLLYFLPTAAVSLLFHRKNGYLDSALLRTAIPFGLLAALPAAYLATTLDVSLLRRPFGLFLLYAGIQMLFPARRNASSAK